MTGTKDALLLSLADEEEKPLYAVTLILVQTPDGMEAGPLQQTEYEGKIYNFNEKMTKAVLALVQNDLNISSIIKNLAGALTSREDPDV